MMYIILTCSTSNIFVSPTVGGADNVNLIYPFCAQVFGSFKEAWHVAPGAAGGKL